MSLGKSSAKVYQGSFGNCLAIAMAELCLAKWQGSANNTNCSVREILLIAVCLSRHLRGGGTGLICLPGKKRTAYTYIIRFIMTRD